MLQCSVAAKNSKEQSFEVEITQRGAITIPPQIRKNLGLDKAIKPMRFIVEQKDGGLFLRPTVTIPVRDFTVEEMQSWISDDNLSDSKLRKLKHK